MDRTRHAPPPRTGAILLNKQELDKILGALGHSSYRDKAEYLGVGVATLHSAYKGKPVGERLIRACRTALPRIPYERLFREER